MRVPTYASYTGMTNAISQNKNLVDKYAFQSITGLKSQTYSGYGMSAYNIVSMESTLTVTNRFLENNKVVETELKTTNLAMQTITDALNDFKSMLNEFNGMDLSKVNPDYTGGELTFTSDDINTYLGKTLNINGTEYTFATTNGAADINISGLTSAEDIMKAVAAKVNDKDFVYDNGKLSFPLYTINGTSTALTEEPAVSAIQTGEAHTMTSEQYLAMQNLQSTAFSTLKLIADTLNTYINGKYIFGGGSTERPVNFDFSTLEEFQSYYDGINSSYPSSAAAQLSSFSVNAADAGVLEFVPDANADNQGTIKATGGSFIKESMTANASATGDLSFDSAVNTMKATEYGAFNTLKAGDTVIIGGSNADLGDNAKMYVVKSVSADGRTVTFDSSTPVAATATFTPNNDVTIGKTFPLGTVVDLNGFENKNLASSVQITGVSNDGSELYVKVNGEKFPAMDTTNNSRWSLEAQSYYRGGDLEYNQRISENQNIVHDIKASDPAFEKIFRALGQMAQGNLVDTSNSAESGAVDLERTRNLVSEAFDLVADALYSGGNNVNVKNADLYSISAKVNSSYVLLDTVVKNQEVAATNLENNIYSLKNVDKNEASTKLLLASNALEASYSVLAQVSSLSLVNYLK